MIRYLSLAEALELHRSVLERWGGSGGIRDINALESALAQPRQGFGGADLYPDLATKAAALCFSLVLNHPFVDGNKRIGHAAMEVFLMLNGHELRGGVDEQEQLMLQLTAGNLKREVLTEWVKQHLVPVKR
ncbi:MAG: type II toxin-antitoxin system death-on-curing family toxin [Nitrospirota bacterium]|nr:type II toxin-antitoxin system death-on-curing family toxin [Nitrospirota bacterium]MDE3242282.1 type II toxin-antitoxin system death-on-curing family toxin [Nitrospirota bacterium]